MVSKHKFHISIIFTISVSLFAPNEGQQRGLTGYSNIQIQGRIPIVAYAPQTVQTSPSSRSIDDDDYGQSLSLISRSDYIPNAASLIQFDRSQDTEPSPLTSHVQNDPSTNANNCLLEEGIMQKIKLKIKQHLESRRQSMEKSIESKFNKLETTIKTSDDSFLDSMLKLNETLASFENYLQSNLDSANALEKRVDADVDNSTLLPDNALLHVYSMITSIDLSPKSWAWSLHSWIETYFEYDSFLDDNPQLRDSNQGNNSRMDSQDDTVQVISVTDCGGPAITMTEGILSFNPNNNNQDWSKSGGTCVWAITPKDAKSVLVKMENDGFFKQHSNANITFVPHEIGVSSLIRHGKNYDKSNFNKNCAWEWSCRDWYWGDAPSSTLFTTDRVVNILKESSQAANVMHMNRKMFTFTEKVVYVILSFDPPEVGTPPDFTISFKGRSCWFCEDDKKKVDAQDWINEGMIAAFRYSFVFLSFAVLFGV